MSKMRRDVAVTFVNSVIAFMLGMGLAVLLARVLGPEERGKYAILLMFLTVLLKVGTLGIEVATVFFTASGRYSANDVVSNGLAASIFLGVAVCFLFWASSHTAPFVSYLNRTDIRRLVVVLPVAMLPGLMLRQFLNRYLLGAGRVLAFNVTDTFQVVVQLAFTIVFTAVLGMGLRGAILGYILALALDLVVIVLITQKTARIRLRINFSLLKDSVSYGVRAYLGNIAQFLNYRLDMFLVSILLDNAAVGHYAIAVGLAERLWMIPGAVSTVILPRVSAVFGTKADSQLQSQRMTVASVKHTLLIVVAAATVLSIVSRFLILLFFGNEYLPSVGPFVVLLPGVVMLSVSKILTSDLAGRGRPEFGAISSAVSLIINVVLNLLLIPRWGIKGAAFASTVSYSVSTAMVIFAFGRMTHTRVVELVTFRSQDFEVYRSVARLAAEKLGRKGCAKRRGGG